MAVRLRSADLEVLLHDIDAHSGGIPVAAKLLLLLVIEPAKFSG